MFVGLKHQLFWLEVEEKWPKFLLKKYWRTWNLKVLVPKSMYWWWATMIWGGYLFNQKPFIKYIDNFYWLLQSCRILEWYYPHWFLQLKISGSTTFLAHYYFWGCIYFFHILPGLLFPFSIWTFSIHFQYIFNMLSIRSQ